MRDVVVLGVGVDLCGIARIARAMERAHFMFAAKEAVAKALGTGFSGGVSPGQIGVCHAPGGMPHVVLTGAALERLQALGGRQVQLSLSHEQDMAVAFAVITG